MSSRVHPPNRTLPVERLVWRAMDEPGKEGPAEEPAIDWEARIRDIERACEQRVREAQAAGQREGESTGRAKAMAELQPVIDRAARSIAEIACLRPKLRQDAESDLVQLALAIARRILHRELAIDPDAMQGLVHSALDRLKAHEINRVRVHPSMAQLMTDSLRRHNAHSAPEVIADAALDRGSFVFETNRGNLDASVETQLKEIDRGLTDRLRRH